MENLAHTDITGRRHHTNVVPLEIPDVPDRELRAYAPRPESGKPMHVRSVHQMLAYAQHVARNPGVAEYGMIADPGLGKSTVFPLMLAKRTTKVVLVVEFCSALAECVYDGMVRVRDASAEHKSVSVSWYGNQNDASGISGLKAPHVAVISARKLLGRIALGGSFPDMIVIHDESHYSDYAAYTWRQVAAEYPWAKTRISLSATLTPSIMSENSALDCVRHEKRVVSMVVPPVRSWVERTPAEDAAVPWAVASLRDKKTLIFSEDVVANEEYGRFLQKGGVEVHHLRVGAKAVDVKLVRERTQQPVGSVVVFADSAYRNGYNFELDVVIDCGLVREEYIADDKVWERYRLANAVEVLQGAARVGRMKSGVVYRNAADYPTYVPLLALGEVRHAAAIHILLGFKPSKVLCDLVPEVDGWNVTEALRVVRCGLDDVLRIAEVISRELGGVTSPPSYQAEEEAAPVPSTASGLKISLTDVLAKARALNIEARHVDDAFPLNHPGARYLVPLGFERVPEPYWVSATNAVKMMRKLLSGQGSYDVAMLTEVEVQWFALQLTRAWNRTADAVVERSMVLAAVGEIDDAHSTMHGYAWTKVQTTHQDVAFMVRELDALMVLMRGLYLTKPFAVKLEDLSSSMNVRRRFADAQHAAATTCVGRISSTGSSGSSSGSYRLTDLESARPVPYSWHTPKVVGRQKVRITDGSVSSGQITSDGYKCT